MQLNNYILARKEYWRILYLSLFLFLVIAQIGMALNSVSQIRHEELAESVRNVWWLQNHQIYDGISSNIGWYGTLLLQYNIFGFSIYGAKVLKALIQIISLAFLFKIALTFISKKIAWIPLMIYGLSPSVLFFSTLQTSFGVDVPYSIIAVYLLLAIPKTNSKKQILSAIFFGFFLMLASMSYPSFILYLPIFFILFLVKFWRDKKRLLLLIGSGIIGAISPLVISFLYLSNPTKLFYDPAVNSGIFRGGGGFPDNTTEMISNINGGARIVLKDLFLIPTSYYFEVARVEFSHILSLVSVLTIVVTSLAAIIIGIKRKNREWWYGAMLLSALPFGLAISTISSWFPGLRRSTILISVFYALVFWLCWYLFKKQSQSKINYLVLLPMIFLLFHHLKVYPDNFKALLTPSEHAESNCFSVLARLDLSLQQLIGKSKESGLISTSNQSNSNECRLAEIYSATAGSCYWNNLGCSTLKWHDPSINKEIILSIQLWEDYYFKH